MKISLPEKRLKAGLVLSTLALTALWVRRTAKKAEQQFPPTGKFVEVDGVRLHYIEQGSVGPTVLLLHGNGTQALDFSACGLMETLASRYRVIAIDRPGFGYSERPRGRLWTPEAQARLLKTACEKLDIQNPIVLGHSYGTLVALAMALDHPSLVRGLVLVSGYYFPTFRLDAWLLSPPAIPVIGDVMRYTVSPLLGKLMMHRMLKQVFSPKEIDQRFVDQVSPTMMLRPSQLKASAEESGFLIPAAAALSRRYKEISVPVEILAGADDKHVKSSRQSVRLNGEIANSRLQLIPGEGHMLHYGRSEEIAHAIDRIAASRQLAVPPAIHQDLYGRDAVNEALDNRKLVNDRR